MSGIDRIDELTVPLFDRANQICNLFVQSFPDYSFCFKHLEDKGILKSQLEKTDHPEDFILIAIEKKENTIRNGFDFRKRSKNIQHSYYPYCFSIKQ